MRIISIREYNKNLSLGKKETLVHFNPDDSVIVFEQGDLEIYEKAKPLLLEASAQMVSLDQDKIISFVGGVTSKEETVSAKKEPSKKSDDWKSRTLAKLSSNNANIQTLKSVLKEVIEKL